MNESDSHKLAGIKCISRMQQTSRKNEIALKDDDGGERHGNNGKKL